nr:hypothetical protein [Streptomyces sp. NRRL S-118]
MTTDLDTLATALHVQIDGLPKAAPHLAPWRPRVGITPKLGDAELVTLAVMQALLGFVSGARWLRHCHAHLRHLFLYLPQQSGHSKRLRRAAGPGRARARPRQAGPDLARRPELLRPGVPAAVGGPGHRAAAARKGESERAGSHLFKPLRQLIESVNDTLKGQLDLEQHGGRTPGGVAVRILQRLLALTAAIRHNHTSGAPVVRSLTAYDH